MGYNDEGRYKVVAAIDVETDLDEFVSYLLVKKKSRQRRILLKIMKER